MNNWVCIKLAMATWARAFLLAIILIIALPDHFCGHNVINHFTCEVQALLKLTCSDSPVRLILELALASSLFHLHSYLLHLHCGCCDKDPFCRSHAQSHLHLWIPPDCGHHILWNSCLHVPETLVKEIPGSG